MTSQKNNPNDPIVRLQIGKIVEVDGLHIIAELSSFISELSLIYEGNMYSIGQFGSIIKIHFGKKMLFAYVSRLRMKADYQAERGIIASSDERIIEADLFGEGEWKSSGNCWRLDFDRGVSTYPLPMQNVYITLNTEIQAIFGKTGQTALLIGEHVGAGHVPCYVDFNELLCKHTAIVGSTGSGKSCTVASILHSIIEKGPRCSYENWNPNIVILDPHGEYEQAFMNPTVLSTDRNSLKLPYWILNLQELSALLIGRTEYAATSQANIVKVALLGARQEASRQLSLDTAKITVDSPIPFSWTTFKRIINMNMPSTASKLESYNSILNKLDVLCSDMRYDYMMHEWSIDEMDPFYSILNQFLGVGNQPCIVDLSGIPNEVAGLASAVISRTLFNFKIWQTPEERQENPILLVCEEAHRYVPNRGEAQYEAAQEAIRRIATEGRKYGIGLFLISQRPSELEATVLSQCNSWIVLRITNDTDIGYIKSILPDGLSSLTSTLSGLKRQEALLVGQAALLPSRIRIKDLPFNQRPKSADVNFDVGWQNSHTVSTAITTPIKRWRYQKKLV